MELKDYVSFVFSAIAVLLSSLALYFSRRREKRDLDNHPIKFQLIESKVYLEQEQPIARIKLKNIGGPAYYIGLDSKNSIVPFVDIALQSEVKHKDVIEIKLVGQRIDIMAFKAYLLYKVFIFKFNQVNGNFYIFKIHFGKLDKEPKLIIEKVNS